jgi:hypothetical protein
MTRRHNLVSQPHRSFSEYAHLCPPLKQPSFGKVAGGEPESGRLGHSRNEPTGGPWTKTKAALAVKPIAPARLNSGPHRLLL